MQHIMTHSSEETFAAGEQTGLAASPGTIILLSGDLGAGKTVFAKGVAAGLGVAEPVTSPTFTIIREYRSGRLPLFHFDLYRLTEEDELYAIGADEYWNSDGVCVIEWADLFPDLDFDSAVCVEIRKCPEAGDDVREITISRKRGSQCGYLE